ncbi:MAG TPA: hypothetical protein VGL27_05835, partial [Negativicutes bacterium]
HSFYDALIVLYHMLFLSPLLCLYKNNRTPKAQKTQQSYIIALFCVIRWVRIISSIVSWWLDNAIFSIY